jgi:Homeodomain-like domain
VSTIERTRKRFVDAGLEAALHEQPRPGARRKLAGTQEAFLIALACSEPPTGRTCWTMQLLADRIVELGGLRPLPMKRCVACSKKHAQALAAAVLVHPHCECGVRLA